MKLGRELDALMDLHRERDGDAGVYLDGAKIDNIVSGLSSKKKVPIVGKCFIVVAAKVWVSPHSDDLLYRIEMETIDEAGT